MKWKENLIFVFTTIAITQVEVFQLKVSKNEDKSI